MLQSYRRMLVFAAPYWKHLALAAVIIVANSLLGLALPLAIRGVIDSTLQAGNQRLLNLITLGLLALFAAQAVLGFGQSYLVGWTGERVVADLRQSLYAHLQSMPLSFFASSRVGELLSRLGNDVMTIQEAVTTTVLSLLSQTIMFVGGLIIILLMSWRLSLVMLAIVPLAVVGMLLLGRSVRRISKQVQDSLADVSSMADESLSGVRIVKSFAREPYEIARYSAGVERLLGHAIERVRLRSIVGPLIGFLGFASIAIVLWFGSREVIAGRLTPGQLVSFLLYTMMIASPLASFVSLYAQTQQAMGASERVFDLLDTPPEMQDAPDALPIPPIVGEVRFEGISFDYRDASAEREVLSGIDILARPGEVVALVGPSGAGKTTLVNLIPRFYDPTTGRLLIDGHDIRTVTMSSLREQIGIVPQETALFSGTVRDNIAYGRLEASQEEIEEAARAANAHDFVQAFPAGYDTVVGERGVKLSGGQRQRIAIARALLKNPRILILDEATSSLDSESELAVQEALMRLMRDRTTFVIAHRLSTVTSADRIVVLENGRVVEQGSHADLLAQDGGLYRRMAALQFQWEDLRSDAEEADLVAPAVPAGVRTGLPILGLPFIR
jgi:subfamily B ATP-binding cassette protein MsbA